jgi:hypothetical protein
VHRVYDEDTPPLFHDLIVCQPLTRLCKVIPPPTLSQSYKCFFYGDEWVLEKTVELQELVREVRNQDACELQFTMLNKIVSVTEGSVLLCTDEGVGLVSVDLITMEFKRVTHDKDKYHGPAYMYQLPWPPTIRACLD